VLCTATVEDGVPPFLDGKGRGWVSAKAAEEVSRLFGSSTLTKEKLVEVLLGLDSKDRDWVWEEVRRMMRE